MKPLPLVVILISLFFYACENDVKKQDLPSKISQQQLKKEILKSNSHFLKIEDQNIQDYIQRHGYNMLKTGTGLYYEVYQASNGAAAKVGDMAVMNYSVCLLNGAVVYDSKQDGLKEFVISKGGVESGLEEGILLLKNGERARFILPSHLAFGWVGDYNRIPRKAVLVYDIELINLK